MAGNATHNSWKGLADTSPANANIARDTMLEHQKNIIRKARERAGSAMVATTKRMTGGPGIAKAPFISPDATPVANEAGADDARSLGTNCDSTIEAITTDTPIQSWNSLTDNDARNHTPTAVPNKAPTNIGFAGATGNCPHHER